MLEDVRSNITRLIALYEGEKKRADEAEQKCSEAEQKLDETTKQLEAALKEIEHLKAGGV